MPNKKFKADTGSRPVRFNSLLGWQLQGACGRKKMNVSEKRNEYTKFLRNSKDLFGMLHGSKRKNVELSNIYGFCVCPGGSNGGIDNRVLEVFYGNRPANSYKSIGQNWNISNKIIIEHGALLHYFQLDNGNVLVSLVPARTENIGPVEDEIIIDYIKNIKKLNNIWYLRKHWLFFISYMNQTAIAGNRNILNWIILLYLRNCKRTLCARPISLTLHACFIFKLKESSFP